MESEKIPLIPQSCFYICTFQMRKHLFVLQVLTNTVHLQYFRKLNKQRFKSLNARVLPRKLLLE